MRRVVAQPVELLVRLREDVLEDVLGVLGREAKAANADRVDVAREALDERGPRLGVAGAAARDEELVTQAPNRRHPPILVSTARAPASASLFELACALGHRLEERPGDRRVLLHERPELPLGQPVHLAVAGRRDRRCAQTRVEQRDLAEVVAGARASAAPRRRP